MFKKNSNTLFYIILIIFIVSFIGGKVYYDSQNYSVNKFHSIVKESNYEEIKNSLDKVRNINAKNDKGETALILAIKNNNIDVVKLLLENGAKADINIKTKQDETPLILAVEKNNIDIAKLLLENGAEADINISSDRKRISPLHLALENKNANMVDLLIDYEADLNFSNNSGLSPLLIAIKSQLYNSASKLINAGANIDENPNLLMLTLKNRNIPIDFIKKLINNDVNINYKNENSESVLSLAAAHKDQKIIEFLFENDISLTYEQKHLFKIFENILKTNKDISIVNYILESDIDMTYRNKKRQTLLMKAVSSTVNPLIIERLIDTNININSRDINDLTALHHAINKNYSRGVSVLIENGTDSKLIIDGVGNYLNYAVIQGASSKIISQLLNSNIDVNRKGFIGVTPLGHIVNSSEYSRSEKNKLIQMLIKNGANVNVKTLISFPSVFMALKNKLSTETIMAMFKAGANVNTKVAELKQTLLMQAAFYAKDPIIVEYLLKNGADPKVKDIKGRTAFDYAQNNENIKNTRIYRELNDAVNQ